MNEKFINLVKQSNKSAYAISKETGIPYTTLSELLTKKKSINKIASETVYKLCLYLKCDMKDILNEVSFYDCLEGKYKSIRYKYIKDDTSIKFYIIDKKEEHLIDEYKNIYVQNPLDFASLNAKAWIENYLDEKELKKEYEKLLSNAQK